MADFLEFFSFDTERRVARDIAATLGKKISAKLMTERRQVLSAKRISQHLEEAYEQAALALSGRRLGMMRRAVLANTFRWELKTAGFPDDFVSVATEGLIVALTPGKKKNR